MGKKISIVALLVIVGAIVYGIYSFNKPAESVTTSNADLKVTATALIDMMESNPEAARTLINQVIEVTGKVSLLEKGEQTTIVILNEQIKCEIENAQLEGSLTIGTEITVKGVYSGLDEMFNEIILSKCQLIN